jgi:hypothetical protein
MSSQAPSNGEMASRKAGTGGEIAGVGDAIRLARALTEEKFLAIGQGLEASVDILARLTATFQALQAELEGEGLKQAARDILGAASGVTALSGSYQGEREALGQLIEVAAAIDGRIARMHKAVKAVDVLGVSAKIEAMHIGDAGTDFLSFANEIDRSLKLAQVNLAELAREIVGVRGHLEKASMGERDFDKRHAEALRLVPARLAASVDSISAHREQAVGATSAVAGRSRQIGQRIGEAVMALQIGDITRQRIEHVEQALEIFDRIAQSPDGSAPGTPVGVEPDGWHLLSQAERQRLIALGCKLQSAQLSDVARELDQEVGRIFASLQELTRSAAEIVRLGEQAYGSSEGRRGTFLLELEEEVGRARALLEGFLEARANADQVVESVRGATTSLAGHVGTIQSLEADIRIMGLNTTLKCGRLGNAGRPLSVIAQELRVCANLTAIEADSIMVSLERMTACVGSLSGQEQERRAADIAAVSEAMTASVGRLGAAGHDLADALGTLKRDSDAVTGLLAETVSRITVHEEIGAVLRQAAADLADALEGVDPVAGDTTPAEDRMLALIAASYTMAREREIHDQVIRGNTASASGFMPSSLGAPAAEGALDDILF